jgi:tripartite-type tricarboxylate transporter receptor subunit TctC
MGYAYCRLFRAPLLLGLFLVAFTLPAAADPVADFYKDRQLNLVLGFSPGGGFDAYARLVTRTMPKYIPGEPRFITRNMPGAGSMIAANHVYNVSPKDGSEFGLFSADVIIAPMFGMATAKFDGRKFTWIGSASSDAIYCVAMGAAPFHTIDDTFKNEMLMGAAGIEMANVPALLNNILGTKFKVIKGYAGTAAVKLAAQRGEVQGWCNVGLESVRGANPEWLTDGTLRLLGQVGYEKRDDVPNVPYFPDYAKSDADRQVLKIIFGYPYMARPFGGPPGIPADRAAALRKAFDSTLKDKAFLEEAEKSRLEVRLITGAEIDKFLGDIYRSPKPIVDRATVIHNEIVK